MLNYFRQLDTTYINVKCRRLRRKLRTIIEGDISSMLANCSRATPMVRYAVLVISNYIRSLTITHARLSLKEAADSA